MVDDFTDSGAYTPQTLLRKRALAEAMLQQGQQTTPISSPWQGLARLAQGAIGGYDLGQLDKQERAQSKIDAALMTQLFGGGATPATNQTQIAAASAQPALSVASGAAPVSDMPAYSNAISQNESGGNYGELGPVIPKTGDRAYGKYQVMGANVGPWTKEILGKEMTPQQFLLDRDAQESVFKGKFGQYVQKYGPEGASKAWFAGEGGMNNPNAKDQLGTTVQGYANKFAANLGVQPPTSDAGNVLSPSTGGVSSGQLSAAAKLSLSGDPRKATLGNAVISKAIASDMNVPPELREYAFYQKQSVASGQQPLSFSDWDLQRRTAAAAKTSINMGENKLAAAVGEGIGKEITSGHQAAQEAVQSIQANNQARQLLDNGVMTGIGANIRVALQKAAQLGGLPVDTSRLSNTEAFVAQRAQETGRIIKQFGSGTGLSDADRIYATKAAAGDIELNEESIRKILDLNERVSRALIERNNANVAKLKPGTVDYDLTVQMPEAYRPQQKPQATIGAPPATAPAAQQYQEGQTATNPQTGQKMIFRAGQWVNANGQ